MESFPGEFWFQEKCSIRMVQKLLLFRRKSDCCTCDFSLFFQLKVMLIKSVSRSWLYIHITAIKMSTTVLTPEKKGHPLIHSMLNTRKRKRTRINNENLFFCWKEKTCLSVAMGNKLNSLIQITGEFDMKELSQDISCMKINILDIRCWRSRTF